MAPTLGEADGSGALCCTLGVPPDNLTVAQSNPTESPPENYWQRLLDSLGTSSGELEQTTDNASDPLEPLDRENKMTLEVSYAVLGVRRYLTTDL
jgi:hypothetical protein